MAIAATLAIQLTRQSDLGTKDIHTTCTGPLYVYVCVTQLAHMHTQTHTHFYISIYKCTVNP